METRHRLGGAQAVASPGSEPSPVPRPTAPSAASPPSSLEPAKDARGSAASVDDVSEALASASPLSGLSRDGKTPIRAVKRSIDAYLERRRSGSAAAASTRSSPVVPRRSDDAPPRRTEPSFATMTAKQRALEPPKLVIRDVTDSNPSHGFESETFLESDPEPFTYAPVYSPAAARDATASLHSSFKTSSSISSAARTEESPQPSKRRFARGVDSIGVDLRARLRAAARVVSPRERDADDARTSPTRFSKNSDSDASDDGDAFIGTGDAFSQTFERPGDIVRFGRFGRVFGLQRRRSRRPRRRFRSWFLFAADTARRASARSSSSAGCTRRACAPRSPPRTTRTSRGPGRSMLGARSGSSAPFAPRWRFGSRRTREKPARAGFWPRQPEPGCARRDARRRFGSPRWLRPRLPRVTETGSRRRGRGSDRSGSCRDSTRPPRKTLCATRARDGRDGNDDGRRRRRGVRRRNRSRFARRVFTRPGGRARRRDRPRARNRRGMRAAGFFDSDGAGDELLRRRRFGYLWV